MKPVAFLITLCLFSPLLLRSQDYAVTIKGDTLHGKVQLLSYDILDRVEIKSGKKKTSLSAIQVTAVMHDGNTYHPIRTNNRYTLMQLLKQGYLSYYGFRVGSLMTYDGRYLIKRDGKGMEVPNLSFRKVMADFLGDCPQLKQKLDDNIFGKKDIEKIIDEYNDCINLKTVVILSDGQDSTAMQYSNALQALDLLRKKIKGTKPLDTKDDALDVLESMEEKIKKNEPVPKFLVDGLKSYLGNTPLEQDMNAFIAIIKQN